MWAPGCQAGSPVPSRRSSTTPSAGEVRPATRTLRGTVRPRPYPETGSSSAGIGHSGAVDMRRRTARRTSRAAPAARATEANRAISGPRWRRGGGEVGHGLRGVALLGGVVGPAEVARDGAQHGRGGGQHALPPLPHEVREGGLRVDQARVVLQEEADAPLPEEDERAEGERPGAGAAPVAAVEVHEEVEGDRAVLDLLGPVPAQQVEHGRVGTDPVERVGVEDPVAEEGGVVLDGGDHRDPLPQPPAARPARRQRAVPEQLLEEPVDLRGVRGGVEAQLPQVRQDVVVGLGVDGLLADEPDDVLAEPVVRDVRQGLLVDVHEPALAGR